MFGVLLVCVTYIAVSIVSIHDSPTIISYSPG